MTTPRWFFGLDLGQARDHSAIAGIERTHKPRALNSMNRTPCDSAPLRNRFNTHFYDVRLLERFPLGTPFSAVNDRLRAVLRNPALGNNPSLAVDATGLGAPVVEMLRAAPLGARLVPVVVTSGDASSFSGTAYRVPKRELVSNLVLALETGSLRIPHRLPARRLLLEEFASFKTCLSSRGRASYGASPGAHDDLIAAISLALWWAFPKGPCGEQSHGPLL